MGRERVIRLYSVIWISISFFTCSVFVIKCSYLEWKEHFNQEKHKICLVHAFWITVHLYPHICPGGVDWRWQQYVAELIRIISMYCVQADWHRSLQKCKLVYCNSKSGDLFVSELKGTQSSSINQKKTCKSSRNASTNGLNSAPEFRKVGFLKLSCIVL